MKGEIKILVEWSTIPGIVNGIFVNGDMNEYKKKLKTIFPGLMDNESMKQITIIFK